MQASSKKEEHAEAPCSDKIHRCIYPVKVGKPEDERFEPCGKCLKYYAFRTHLKVQHLEPEGVEYDKSMIRQYSRVVDDSSTLEDIVQRLTAIEAVLCAIADHFAILDLGRDAGSTTSSARQGGGGAGGEVEEGKEEGSADENAQEEVDSDAEVDFGTDSSGDEVVRLLPSKPGRPTDDESATPPPATKKPKTTSRKTANAATEEQPLPRRTNRMRAAN